MREAEKRARKTREISSTSKYCTKQSSCLKKMIRKKMRDGGTHHGRRAGREKQENQSRQWTLTLPLLVGPIDRREKGLGLMLLHIVHLGLLTTKNSQCSTRHT